MKLLLNWTDRLELMLLAQPRGRLGVIPSMPAAFLTFNLERTSNTSAGVVCSLLNDLVLIERSEVSG